MATVLRRRKEPRSSPDSMTLTEHLGELRSRLIVCVIIFAVGAVASYVVYNQILDFLLMPYKQVTHNHDPKLYITGPLQGFSLRLDVATYGGLLIAFPVILFELWRFVTPGLKANEKRYAIPFVTATMVLFALGATVAYETFPHALRFLISVGGHNLAQIFSPQSYIQLILLLMLAFGVTFEFPVVLVGLELANVLTPAKLRHFRRWAIIGMVVFAAVVTPSSDPFSMLALALPLLAFYELSIIVGRLLGK